MLPNKNLITESKCDSKYFILKRISYECYLCFYPIVNYHPLKYHHSRNTSSDTFINNYSSTLIHYWAAEIKNQNNHLPMWDRGYNTYFYLAGTWIVYQWYFSEEESCSFYIYKPKTFFKLLYQVSENESFDNNLWLIK